MGVHRRKWRGVVWALTGGLAVMVGAQGAQAQTDGDALYAEARELLNAGQYARASSLFERLRQAHPGSERVADSYYYEAFALYRHGQDQGQNLALARGAYERAAELLVIQEQRYDAAATRSEAEALSVRLEAALARAGDQRARTAVGARAQVACSDEESDLRAIALSALIGMDAGDAVPLLRQVIADRNACNAELRAQAVFILSQQSSDEAVDLLLDLAHRDPDPDPEVREAAVHWLAQTNRPEALDALLSILESSDDPEVLESAVFALSQTGDPRAKARLRALASDASARLDTRAKAIFWIGQQAGDLQTMLDLYAEMDHPELRQSVIFGIGQIVSPESRAWMRALALDRSEDPELRGQAVFWLAQSNGSIEDMRAIYDQADEVEVREQVLFGLSQMDDSEAVDVLMEVARSDPDRELRSKAVFWLGQTNDPRVPEFLMEIIRR